MIHIFRFYQSHLHAIHHHHHHHHIMHCPTFVKHFHVLVFSWNLEHRCQWEIPPLPTADTSRPSFIPELYPAALSIAPSSVVRLSPGSCCLMMRNRMWLVGTLFHGKDWPWKGKQCKGFSVPRIDLIRAACSPSFSHLRMLWVFFYQTAQAAIHTISDKSCFPS